MLREDRNNMSPRPMPTPMPRREPVYERPVHEKPVYEKPSYDDYDCPRYEYPMVPQYPNNMNPCPYPEQDMYGDRPMDLDGMMRTNPALRRCVMDCVDRHYNAYPCRPEPCYPYNPCRPMPMPRQMPLTPRRRPHREPCMYGMEDYSEEIETYDFSESHLDNIVADTQVEIEGNEEK